jgi:hypothetical protein
MQNMFRSNPNLFRILQRDEVNNIPGQKSGLFVRKRIPRHQLTLDSGRRNKGIKNLKNKNLCETNKHR